MLPSQKELELEYLQILQTILSNQRYLNQAVRAAKVAYDSNVNSSGVKRFFNLAELEGLYGKDGNELPTVKISKMDGSSCNESESKRLLGSIKIVFNENFYNDIDSAPQFFSSDISQREKLIINAAIKMTNTIFEKYYQSIPLTKDLSTKDIQEAINKAKGTIFNITNFSLNESKNSSGILTALENRIIELTTECNQTNDASKDECLKNRYEMMFLSYLLAVATDKAQVNQAPAIRVSAKEKVYQLNNQLVTRTELLNAIAPDDVPLSFELLEKIGLLKGEFVSFDSNEKVYRLNNETLTLKQLEEQYTKTGRALAKSELENQGFQPATAEEEETMITRRSKDCIIRKLTDAKILLWGYLTLQQLDALGAFDEKGQIKQDVAKTFDIDTERTKDNHLPYHALDINDRGKLVLDAIIFAAQDPYVTAATLTTLNIANDLVADLDPFSPEYNDKLIELQNEILEAQSQMREAFKSAPKILDTFKDMKLDSTFGYSLSAYSLEQIRAAIVNCKQRLNDYLISAPKFKKILQSTLEMPSLYSTMWQVYTNQEQQNLAHIAITDPSSSSSINFKPSSK